MNNNVALLAGVLSVGLVLSSGCQVIPKEPSAATSTENAGTLYDGDARVLYDAKQRAKTSKQAMEFGEQALQTGDIDQALYQFVSAYELDSSQYMALHRVGLIHAREGKLDRAALALKLALQTKPDHAESLIELGLVEMRLRQYEPAQRHIERAVESGPESWRAFNGLAVLADLRKDFESAEQYYQKAIQLNPSSPVLWNNRGYSRYLAGDWDSAQGFIMKALDIDSGYQKAWLNYGLIHVRRGEYDNALSAFERVMRKADAYERIGSLAIMEGKYEIAEYFLDRAIDASPTYYEAAYDKADRLKNLRGHGDEHSLAQVLKNRNWNYGAGDIGPDAAQAARSRGAPIRTEGEGQTMRVHHTASD